MNPFTSRLNSQSWEIPVAVMSLVLGVMVSFAFINEKTRVTRASELDPDVRGRILGGTIDVQLEYQKLQVEVGKLREEKTKLENAMTSNSEQAKVLNESLQESKMLAGITEVEGPGVTVTLTDSAQTDAVAYDRIIHDVDVLQVVNELWAAGAEAITVNGHRVVGSTSFRCVGPVIHVDGVPIASPVVMRAIGEPKTLLGGLNLPGGIVEEIRSMDPKMVKMEEVTKHRLQAYAGSTVKRFAKLPPQDSK